MGSLRESVVGCMAARFAGSPEAERLRYYSEILWQDYYRSTQMWLRARGGAAGYSVKQLRDVPPIADAATARVVLRPIGNVRRAKEAAEWIEKMAAGEPVVLDPPYAETAALVDAWCSTPQLAWMVDWMEETVWGQGGVDPVLYPLTRTYGPRKAQSFLLDLTDTEPVVRDGRQIATAWNGLARSRGREPSYVLPTLGGSLGELFGSDDLDHRNAQMGLVRAAVDVLMEELFLTLYDADPYDYRQWTPADYRKVLNRLSVRNVEIGGEARVVAIVVPQ